MTTTPANLPTSQDSAALLDSTITTFRAGMTAQQRDDAQHSFQLASLAADGLHDRKLEREAWFDELIQTLGRIGWIALRRDYEKETATSTTITVGAVALNVFGAVGRAALGGPIGDALGALASQAFDGLEKMTKDIEVFLAKRNQSDKGMTGIVGCVEANGTLYMVISAVDTKLPNNDVDVLGINVKLEGREYYKGTAVLTYSPNVYDKVRQPVADKLGAHALEGVLNIRLGSA